MQGRNTFNTFQFSLLVFIDVKSIKIPSHEVYLSFVPLLLLLVNKHDTQVFLSVLNYGDV